MLAFAAKLGGTIFASASDIELSSFWSVFLSFFNVSSCTGLQMMGWLPEVHSRYLVLKQSGLRRARLLMSIYIYKDKKKNAFPSNKKPA